MKPDYTELDKWVRENVKPLDEEFCRYFGCGKLSVKCGERYFSCLFSERTVLTKEIAKRLDICKRLIKVTEE